MAFYYRIIFALNILKVFSLLNQLGWTKLVFQITWIHVKTLLQTWQRTLKQIVTASFQKLELFLKKVIRLNLLVLNTWSGYKLKFRMSLFHVCYSKYVCTYCFLMMQWCITSLFAYLGIVDNNRLRMSLFVGVGFGLFSIII